MKPVFAKSLLTLSIISLLSACGGGGAGGSEEPNPPASVTKEEGFKSSFYSTREIGSTTQCPNGGVEILSGIDVNENGVLDDENTTTHVICHGTDAVSPNISVEDASASQCPNGGKVLKVNTDELVLPLCNVNSVVATPTSEDYPAAKAMMEGFKNWITTLETLGNSAEALGDELNDKSQALEDLYGHGADSAIQSMGKILSLMDGMVSAGVDSTLDLSTRGDIDATGTLTYSKTNNTMVASNVKVTMFKNNEAIVTTIEMPTIVLPDSSGTRFELKMENVTATNTKASLALPIVEAILTTQNQVSDLANNEDIFATGGELALSIKLGDNDKLVTIKNLPAAGKEADQITFTGKLDAELVGYQLRIDSVNEEQNYINPKTLNFAGDLSYDGKQVQVDLGFEMHNLDNYRFTEEAIKGLELINDQGELSDFAVISATDVTQEAITEMANNPTNDITPFNPEDLNQFVADTKLINLLDPGEEDPGYISGVTPGSEYSYSFEHSVFGTVNANSNYYYYQDSNFIYYYYGEGNSSKEIDLHNKLNSKNYTYDLEDEVFTTFIGNRIFYNPSTERLYTRKYYNVGPNIYVNATTGEAIEGKVLKATKYVLRSESVEFSIDRTGYSDTHRRAIAIGEIDLDDDGIVDEYLTENLYSVNAAVNFQYPDRQSNSLQEIEKSVLHKFFDEIYPLNCDDSSVNTLNCQWKDYGSHYSLAYEGELQVNLLESLPSPTTNKSYNLKITRLDIERLEEIPTFENHRKYTLNTKIDVKGLKDNQGNTLEDVSLDVVAKRNGFLMTSGSLEFTLSYAGNSFKAIYTHRDANNNPNNMYESPREFIFEDGKGGKLVFGDVIGHHSTYDSVPLIYPRGARLYYNGLKHGYLKEYENGDWYITYYDKTEDRIFQAQ